MIDVECVSSVVPPPGDMLTVGMVDDWLVLVPRDAQVYAITRAGESAETETGARGLIAKWRETRD